MANKIKMPKLIVKGERGVCEINEASDLWVRVLSETPLQVRRRASPYLKGIRKVSGGEWLVRRGEGGEYSVRIGREGRPTCSCPFFKRLSGGEGYCKHICAVAAYELVRTKVLPWLKRLEEEL